MEFVFNRGMTLHCRKKPQIQKTHCSARGRLGRCHSPFSFLRCCRHVFCCYRGGCDAHLPQARPHRVCTVLPRVIPCRPSPMQRNRLSAGISYTPASSASPSFPRVRTDAGTVGCSDRWPHAECRRASRRGRNL